MKKKIIAFLLFNITFLFGSNVVFAATNSTILRKNPYQKVNYKNNGRLLIKVIGKQMPIILIIRVQVI